MKDNTSRAALVILASAVIILAMYLFREILAPFALAIFLWLVIDGFADLIQSLHRIIPRWLGLTVALITATLSIVVLGIVVANTADGLVSNGAAYKARLNGLVADVYTVFHASAPPTIDQLISRVNPGQFISSLALSLQNLTSNFLFVAVYVGFLFGAQRSFPAKLAGMFPDPDDLLRANRIAGSMREAIEKYLWVQTLTGIFSAVAAYIILLITGVDNPLFWAFLIFLMNYVPTIGPFVATLLPSLFALVQFETYWQALTVFAGIGVIHFIIGTFVQPRMQGDSMNLSTIVVILTLSMWGMIWGLPGMFLSAPLTVMLMIILAQFPSTRWIAILLSHDGQPEKGLELHDHPSM